jgi:2-keto-4-pentenoate hydratase/2-oxohepta-3-ene-1,7-dioic acid hydratase in catechol pathway
MKLCTFEVQTQVGRFQRLGAVTNEGIIDLSFTFEARLASEGEPRAQEVAKTILPSTMLDYLKAGDRGRFAAQEALEFSRQSGLRHGPQGQTLVYSMSEIKLLTPLPNPPSLRDFFAFEEHVKQGFEKRGEPMPAEWYEIPVYYKGAHHNIVGTDANVRWPSFTEKFDYELELAAVIGKGGRNVPSGRARQHIAGFLVMNDFSARDIQKREMKVRLGPAKGKDWCTALGPWLVTADEIGDPYHLSMEARVNGETWSRGNSSSMHWEFEQMIEFLTQDDAILPGDVIGSGTVGAGCGLELDRWVQRGDTIELDVEKIGVLRNRVI